MTAQFTAKTTNSEKAIYFLPLMSCSTNKVKSHMSLTCENVIFSDFTRKKNFAPENGGGGGEGGGLAPPAPLLYCPGYKK